jgi:cell division protein FtsI/penicillin-binding protein 2
MISNYELALILILVFICFIILLILTYNYAFIKGKKYMLSYLTQKENQTEESDNE